MRFYGRRCILAVAAFVLILPGLNAEQPVTKPNIVVMMVDDMGFAGPSIAPYGNPHYTTPGMDRLATEGMLFTDFHASGAICSATRAGLMTGRYQQRAGIEAVIHPHATHPEHRKGLHENEVTFAELLQDAGYSTGLVGKWHLGYAAETSTYHPMNHGFDYFMGYVSGNIDYINHWGDHMQHDWWHGRKQTKEEGYTTHLINKYALEFIQQNKDKPFCLYIAHESPHAPVQGPEDPIQRGPGAKKRTTPHAEAMKQMMLEMDKGVEQVRAKLIELGLEKNTLFLFFSDNGDAPATATGSPRFRGHKGSVYEGGTRVPAVAWWPGRIKAGTQANDLSITLDVMPTILAVAGVDPPKDRTLDGIDLSPVLFEQKALPARPLFWADLSNNGSRSEALRDGPWKLVVQHPKAKPGTFENEQVELFRLDEDVSEQTNLAATEPKRAATMLKQIKAWYADTQETASPQPGGWLSAAKDARDAGMRELLAASIYGTPNVDIAVPNGTYTLQFLLYEGWRSRSADIVIEGKTVKEKYDMFIEQGGTFAHGSVFRHTLTVTDGNIDIEIKGPLHLGGLILSKEKPDAVDRVTILNSHADLDLNDVIKAINFGDTNDLNIGDVNFAAAAVNTTVDGVTNTAIGDVHAGEYEQQLPQMQKEKAAFKKSEFFNGKDLTGWSASEMKYWSVKDSTIVGHSAVNVPKNEFIWSDVEVQDFYLTVDVKLTPDDRNAGIQFRSKPVDVHGQAIGYQADVGAGVWGKLYHEHGRGKLDWNDNAADAVKPGQWNKYEILAVGDRIWTAINGKLCVAIEDPTGERAGKIAFQIHGGSPQTVHYRNPTLTLDPKTALEMQTKEQLLAALPKKAEAPKPVAPKPAAPAPVSVPISHWSRLIAGADPGSQEEAWAKPAFDHGKWKTMNLPGHFDTVELPGFDGVVWFRKTVELSLEQAQAAATLHLGQIDDMDVTWMNGTRVGGYENLGHHYTVRKYPVPAGVLKPGKNVIAVRVMDHGSAGGIAGNPEQLFLQLNDERISLANRWQFAPGANLAALNTHGQVPALVRPLTRPTGPVPAFADGFAIDSDQTIAVIGSTNALASSQDGYFESLLCAAWPQYKVQTRNIAWQADTVYQQQRPRNFYAAEKPAYGELDGRNRIHADIVFFWMGQTESLDGPDHLEKFVSDYSQHLDQIAKYTQRLVLVTPVPFSNPLGLELDIEKRNKSLASYAHAIRDIGRERGLPVVDLFTALLSKEQMKEHSDNGMHLSPEGQWFAAQAFASQLGFSDRVAHIKKHESKAVLLPGAAEELRQAIKQKNDLWFRYWRPSNWAFLYGNRQQTASSRDHTNPGRRWFPEELQNALPHLVEADQRIHESSASATAEAGK